MIVIRRLAYRAGIIKMDGVLTWHGKLGLLNRCFSAPCIQLTDASSFSTANTEKIIRVDKETMYTVPPYTSFRLRVAGAERSTDNSHTWPQGRLRPARSFSIPFKVYSVWHCMPNSMEGGKGPELNQSTHSWVENTKNTWSAWTIAT
jgi:hypothetical protein